MTTRPYTQFLGPKYWPTWLLLGVARLLGFFPLPVLAALGRGLGLLFYSLGRSRRHIALTNISRCFPEFTVAEQMRINRQHYQFSGQMVLVTGMNWWISKRRFNHWVSIHGREHYDEALADGQNIILLAPHFLALEIAGIYLSQERPMATMYQYNKNALVDEVIRRGRLRNGGELVERKGPLRKLLKLMRRGHPFYYLPDQDAGRKGVFVPFFHELAATIPMLGKFAAMTNAVVIPCRTQIRPWGRGYDVFLGSPLEHFPTGDEIQDTTAMNKVIEQMIRENPEQYFWTHKRYKTRPDGAAQFYK